MGPVVVWGEVWGQNDSLRGTLRSNHHMDCDRESYLQNISNLCGLFFYFFARVGLLKHFASLNSLLLLLRGGERGGRAQGRSIQSTLNSLTPKACRLRASHSLASPPVGVSGPASSIPIRNSFTAAKYSPHSYASLPLIGEGARGGSGLYTCR